MCFRFPPEARWVIFIRLWPEFRHPPAMDILRDLLDIFLHLDAHLNQWAATLGNALYGVLFLIIFCETGLVVTPFLPGDSLLFAAGALASVEHSVLNLPYLAL